MPRKKKLLEEAGTDIPTASIDHTDPDDLEFEEQTQDDISDLTTDEQADDSAFFSEQGITPSSPESAKRGRKKKGAQDAPDLVLPNNVMADDEKYALDIKNLVRGAYRIQKHRIQMSLPLVENYKRKLGIKSGQAETKADPMAKAILKQLRKNYRQITDAITTFPSMRSFQPQGIISRFTEMVMVKQVLDMEEAEAWHFRYLGKIIEEHPLWQSFLKDVAGVGPAMAGAIISSFDIRKAKYSSSLWSYAGLSVINGEGQSRKAAHLREKEYEAKDGTIKTRKDLGYNPWIKSKLVEVLMGSFLKQGPEKSPYAKIYYDSKNRDQNHPEHKDKSKGHIHRRACRRAIKIFLIDLYKAWRPLLGLVVYPSYAEAKLGLIHGLEA